MKASSLLVLFCLLSVILCYTIGITDKELKTMNKRSTRDRLNNYSQKVIAQRNGTLPQDEFNKEKIGKE